MLRVTRILIFIFFLILQSCNYKSRLEVEKTTSPPDLNLAAVYNVQLGLSYLKQGDRPLAKRKLLTALKQAPNSVEVNSALAYYFEEVGQPEQARAYYLKSMELAPKKGAPLNNYGVFLCRQKSYAESISYFLKAIEDENYLNTAAAYENAGLCAAKYMQDEKKVTLYFIKALEQDPKRRSSFYELLKIGKKPGNEKMFIYLIEKFPYFLNDTTILLAVKNIAQSLDVSKLEAIEQKKINRIKYMRLNA